MKCSCGAGMKQMYGGPASAPKQIGYSVDHTDAVEHSLGRETLHDIKDLKGKVIKRGLHEKHPWRK